MEKYKIVIIITGNDEVTDGSDHFMKKLMNTWLSGVLAMLLVFSVIPDCAADSALKGDVNLDGQITGTDVIQLKEYMIGTRSFTEPALINADVNGDGTISTTDLSQLKSILTGGYPESVSTCSQTDIVSILDPQYRPGKRWTDSQYVTVNGQTIDFEGFQCIGFARYVQFKLYGAFSVNGNTRYGSGDFIRVVGHEDDVLSFDEKTLKNWITTKAEAGAHIRTANKSGYYHSMIITSITNDGFTVIDANWSEDHDNVIRQRKYTWHEFVNTFAERKMQYIEVYRGGRSTSHNSSIYSASYSSDSYGSNDSGSSSWYNEPDLPGVGGWH